MPIQDRSQRRQRVLRAQAIVLRHRNWGEADRILGLFTLEMGKVSAIAKGVRRPRSRKAGHLEPFTHVKLLLARGRNIAIITQAEAIDQFTPLREDMLLTTYASYVVELLDRFTYEEGENRRLFRLLRNTLARLCTADKPELALRYYEIRLLDLVGFRPQLYTCVRCEDEIQPQDQFFSAQGGGVLCPSCGARVAGAKPISLTALKYLRHFQRSSYDQATRASLSAPINIEMERLMQHYFTYLLERSLNTPEFIRRARRDTDN